MILVPAAFCTLETAQAESGPDGFDPGAVIAEHGFAPHQVGYLAVDLESGAVLAARNADAAFIPASVTKVPTTVAALAALGPDYRFETTLHGTGPVVDGTLEGDLYLRGGGDPVLTADDLDAMLAQLGDAGIRAVAGGFAYDDGLLSALDRIDPDQPETATYNPGVSALSVNFNVIQVSWETEDDGTFSVTATSNTHTQRVPVDAVLFALAPEQAPQPASFRLGDTDDGELWVLARHLPREGQDWLPVGDAGLNTAMVFRRLASGQGLDLAPPVRASLPEGARLLANHRSAPLSEIARGILRYSNNLSAELVGLVASRYLSGEALPLSGSAARLDGWLQTHLAETGWDGYRPVNHSGLATDARATPRQLVAMLRHALDLPLGGETYAGLLPAVAQLDRESGGPVVVRAKSGTLYYGSGLAGYLMAEGQPRVAFAVFVSDLEARARIDAVTDPAARERPPGARHWLGRARAVQRALLAHWAESRVHIAQR
ncbi:MAG: D-alanyl-D-alanine carboxypeptidase/D-alanyl-D-alanine-endopeptidase [Alphaproteobacteria bacterium]|nr:D-alanyl-D-alanine carboxypeptidase/D-alanyl-D-alanine-endopeptidase [Alphaproteobacteria bacterium]